MQTLTLKSPAKINLFLHITGKRPDSYHNLQTVFRLIDFYDEMQFTFADKTVWQNSNTYFDVITPISLTTDHLDFPITRNPPDNLVIKAARTLYNYARKEKNLSTEQLDNLPFINIKLKKNIPTGAGLGGGSSNCATTLLALNQLWQLNLSNEQLRTIGATLGADVSIFIFGQDAIAEGIGEVLTPINLPPQGYLLLTPNAHINTAQLFAHPKLRRDCPVFSLEQIQAKQADFLDNLTPEFSNVFEPVVSDLSSEVKTALNYLHGLEKLMHSVARMSGSGSSVFLPLSEHLSQNLIKSWQQNAPCPAFVVTTLPNGFLQNALYG